VVADVGAYFSGKRFGRRKLAPQVSPGKSWEGFWGGFIAAQLLAAVFYLWVWDIFNKLGAPPALEANTAAIAALDIEMNFGSLETASIIIFVVVAGLLSAASVLGDLFESVLKRNVGVKDSGNLLPGHGGMLDRIDGMLASVPLLAFFVLLLRW
ncbi:MAG: phosphatidate cytidylyltransferase, partial [Gammaproteobacteria bacterium]|nr:phosphatidate cytidylyltransferase [Gammaproteobacteria bacterium]